MEPTVYAMLALQGAPGSEPAVDRAWSQLATCQLPDGSWRPSPQVQGGSWVTALGVLASCCRGRLDPGGIQGIAWLMHTSGAESRWLVRVFSHFHWLSTSANVDHHGWPWRPGTSAWIEPTAITLLALKKSLRVPARRGGTSSGSGCRRIDSQPEGSGRGLEFRKSQRLELRPSVVSRDNRASGAGFAGTKIPGTR